MSDDVYATEDAAEREMEAQRKEFAAKVERWHDRAEAAERRLAAVEELVRHPVRPRTAYDLAVDIRAALDSTDLKRIEAEWDHDDTRRWEHLAAADPEDT